MAHKDPELQLRRMGGHSASLPSRGGSLVSLVAQTGQGKLSEEQDSEMLPRPALPLFLSPVQPGHTPRHLQGLGLSATRPLLPPLFLLTSG